MDFQLTSEQRMIQESARRMVGRDIQPVLDKQDVDSPLPKEVMRKLLQVCAGQGLTWHAFRNLLAVRACRR